jgi:hypothetical protein
MGPTMVKWTKKYARSNPNLNMAVFQHRHKKIGFLILKAHYGSLHASIKVL